MSGIQVEQTPSFMPHFALSVHFDHAKHDELEKRGRRYVHPDVTVTDVASGTHYFREVWDGLSL